MNPRELFWLSGLAVVLAIACAAERPVLRRVPTMPRLPKRSDLFPELNAGTRSTRSPSLAVKRPLPPTRPTANGGSPIPITRHTPSESHTWPSGSPNSLSANDLSRPNGRRLATKKRSASTRPRRLCAGAAAARKKSLEVGAAAFFGRQTYVRLARHEGRDFGCQRPGQLGAAHTRMTGANCGSCRKISSLIDYGSGAKAAPSSWPGATTVLGEWSSRSTPPPIK